MNLGNVMDEIAVRLRQAPSLAGRTYAFPPATVVAPAAIVTYPDEGTYDETYRRGMDRMGGEMVYVLVGRSTERQSRDLMTKYVNGSGAESVKALLDADGYTSCSYVRVTGWKTVYYSVGGIEYLTAAFDLDIAGQGA
jgi:hypothetical protein